MDAKESMHNPRRGFLSEILSGRTNLIEIIVVAILIALGVNLIADGLVIHAKLAPLTSVILGLIVSLISILYLVVRALGHRTRSRSYAGFFVYDRKKNEVVDVPRYDFSEDLSRNLKAAFLENKALKLIWDREPLRAPRDVEMEEAKSKSKKEMLERWRAIRGLHSSKLIREATEYYVLDLLSTHLTDYFNDEKFRAENLKEFQRNDVPDVLLRNRFLELFSKPMENRPAFVKDFFDDKDHARTTLAYLGGAIYKRFDLVLPKESIVNRVGENSIEIETKRFVIRITVGFEGLGTYIPSEFLKHYLCIDDPFEEVVEYCVGVDVHVLFKFGALLSGTGWEYYQWIDSFLEVLDERISENTFFKTIGWNNAMTVIECLKDKARTKEPKNTKRSRKKGRT
jgi:hypothetical protein